MNTQKIISNEYYTAVVVNKKNWHMFKTKKHATGQKAYEEAAKIAIRKNITEIGIDIYQHTKEGVKVFYV